MRCDYHGTGESTGSVDQFRLDRPFVDDVSAAIDCLKAMGVQDVLLAGSCFGGRSALATAAAVPEVTGVMLLATSPRDYVMGERVSAKKAATWSLGRYLTEAFRPRALRGWFNRRLRRTYLMHARSKLRLLTGGLPGGARRLTERPMGTEVVSPHFTRHLRSVIRRRVPILLLYGTEDGFHREFLEAADGALASILGSTQDAVQVRLTPGRLHGFTSIAIQDAAFDEVIAWAVAQEPAADGPVAALISRGEPT
jgi:pimeloyl-ACP methyl ester carboxylesterase